jgi:hypothetical protein
MRITTPGDSADGAAAKAKANAKAKAQPRKKAAKKVAAWRTAPPTSARSAAARKPRKTS